MTPRLELEPPEKIAPSTVVTARTATFSRKEGSSVEKRGALCPFLSADPGLVAPACS